jgi:hypothetical protein
MPVLPHVRQDRVAGRKAREPRRCSQFERKKDLRPLPGVCEGDTSLARATGLICAWSFKAAGYSDKDILSEGYTATRECQFDGVTWPETLLRVGYEPTPPR